MDLVFHKLHITENTVAVPNNLSYLENVFKSYTLRTHASRQCLTLFWLSVDQKKTIFETYSQAV